MFSLLPGIKGEKEYDANCPDMYSIHFQPKTSIKWWIIVVSCYANSSQIKAYHEFNLAFMG